MNYNYPGRDPSGHDIPNGGYHHAEPPHSNDSMSELNLAALRQPFINKGLFPTSNFSSKAYNMFTAFTSLEIVVFCILLIYGHLFEYCFWSFGFEEYNETEFYPEKLPEEGTHSEFLTNLECDKSDFSRCPGICDVVQRYSDGIFYFSIAYSIRIILFIIFVVWHFIESNNGYYGDVKKRFAYYNLTVLILIIVGVYFALIYPGFQDLGEPLDSNADDLNPERFNWRSGFIFMILIVVWIPISSSIVYYGFNS